MAIKETVFIICLILLPLMIEAEDKTVSSAIQNDEGLVQSLKDDIDEIKQFVMGKKFQKRRKKTLELLDQLSENVEQCSGGDSGGCCPPDWVPGEGSCYYIDNTKTRRMSDARNKCQEMGGELAIIESEKENEFIFDLVKKTDGLLVWGVWIGLQRQDDGSFQWVDGTPVVYNGWETGEPNDHQGIEDCANMYSALAGSPKGEKWNDGPCDWEVTPGFACEMQKSC